MKKLFALIIALFLGAILAHAGDQRTSKGGHDHRPSYRRDYHNDHRDLYWRSNYRPFYGATIYTTRPTVVYVDDWGYQAPYRSITPSYVPRTTILGATAGAIIGNNSGSRSWAKGALIGGLAGLTLGLIADAETPVVQPQPHQITIVQIERDPLLKAKLEAEKAEATLAAAQAAAAKAAAIADYKARQEAAEAALKTLKNNKP